MFKIPLPTSSNYNITGWIRRTLRLVSAFREHDTVLPQDRYEMVMYYT